jgi:predicted N-formylglutamate amidohydrolase
MDAIDLVEPALDEPAAFHALEGAADAQALIICDHACRDMAVDYSDLGLNEAQLREHIAWDIGAGDVSRRLSALMGIPAVLCGTSRLIIDCNRMLDDPSSIPEVSDGVIVPGNQSLSMEQRAQRARRHFWPYHGEIIRRIGEMTSRGSQPLLISVHSFTPSMNGFERPWHVGLLWDHYEALSRRVVAELRHEPDLVVGENQPYTGWEPRGYALHAYGEGMELPMCVFEIRQDLIETADGAAAWAARLAKALAAVLEDPLALSGAR